MEELFQVCLEVEFNNKNDLVIGTDIAKDYLLQNIVRPWENTGNEVLYCGEKAVNKREIRRINIFKSKKPLLILLEERKPTTNQDKRHIIENEAEDVTSNFIRIPVNPWRDTKQICLSGHIITSSYEYKPHSRKDYCDICGEKTITKCPSCLELIPGDLYQSFYQYSGEREPPVHCEKCGKPFPWANLHNRIDTSSLAVEWLENLFTKFHSIAIQLQRRHKQRDKITITDEYDMQDIIRSFLVLKFDDVRLEEWTPSYAGNSSRMDFLLKDHGIIIESKITRPSHGSKEISDELIIDLTRYKTHPDCRILVCFIYDRDSVIENPKGFIKDMESDTPLPVRVFINT
jgi:hypothetical protein